MYCTGCGKEIPDNTKFCPHCGKKTAAGEAAAVNTFAASSPQVSNPAPPRKVKKEKQPFKVNAALIVSILEIVILGLLIFGFFKLGAWIFGPENAAKDFMQAYADDDWETLYAMIDMPESDFLEGSSLKKIMEEQISSDFEDYDTSLASSRGNSASVKVKYGDEGSLKNKATLNLEKQGDKRFVFFDTWKVTLEDAIINNPVIYVPTGMDAYFDGILISRDYLQEGYVPQSEYYGNSYEYDAYVLPEIYAGEHTAAAVMGEYTVASSKVRLDEENKEILVNNIILPEDLQKKITEDGFAYMQRFLEARVNGENFQNIKDIYKNDKEILDRAKNNYEYNTDYYYAFNKETGIKKISVSDPVGNVSSYYLNDGTLTAEVQFNFTYDATYVDKDWWSGEKSERKNENMSGSCYEYLVYSEDGSWKLTDIQMSYNL